MDAAVIQHKIVEFLVTTTGQSSLDAETDLESAGLIDSLAMMDLLVFFEGEFGVRLEFEDLTPDVFHSAATIARRIEIRVDVARAKQAA
jgi:acyl carrier protein